MVGSLITYKHGVCQRGQKGKTLPEAQRTQGNLGPIKIPPKVEKMSGLVGPGDPPRDCQKVQPRFNMFSMFFHPCPVGTT